MNAGEKTIQWLRNDQLQVDPEWSVSRSGGFTWWPHRHAQHIDVVRDYQGPSGDKAYLVRIRTEFLRKAGPLQPTGGEAVALQLLMSTASMAGLVHDPAQGMLYLSSAVRVHDGVWQWMARLLSVAAMTQITDAQFLADKFGAMLGAAPATSDHPRSGARTEPDEIAASFPAMSHDFGQRPSRWTEAEFAQALPLMKRPPSVMTSGGGVGVTIEFPYGSRTSLCRMVADEAHPRLGNGLLLLQSFPVEHLGRSETQLREIALEHNRVELGEDAKGYGFGSYCYQDGCIHWNGFLPNVCYTPGLLPNLFFACAGRAAYMATQLQPPAAAGGVAGRRSTGRPASDRPLSGMERLLRFFRGGG